MEALAPDRQTCQKKDGERWQGASVRDRGFFPVRFSEVCDVDDEDAHQRCVMMMLNDDADDEDGTADG